MRSTSVAFRASVLLVLLVVVGARRAEAQACTAAWQPGFAPPAGVNGSLVEALCVFDDGNGGGPALYAAGQFFSAGNVAVKDIARWNGSTWAPVGAGFNGTAHDMTVFDDGRGAAIYVAGELSTIGFFTTGIARWDGTAWSALGSGLPGIPETLEVYNDGSGESLYVGGDFTFAASDGTANKIARWNGSAWTVVGGGFNQLEVTDLVGFDDGMGGGTALYAAGFFSKADDLPASNIARWDGAAWAPVGSGFVSWVQALGVFDDGRGGGPQLYAGGTFNFINSVQYHGMARWNGAAWLPVGGGLGGVLSGPYLVRVLAVHDDGSGPALYAGGHFSPGGGAPGNRIARWDGTAWSPLGGGMTGTSPTQTWVRDLVSFDDGYGGGTSLFAGGKFTAADGVPSSHIARWGCPQAAPPWSQLGSGLAGVAGVPSLVGVGTLATGSAGALTLTNARPAATSVLFVSLASTPVPFKGGVLVPIPALLPLALVASAAGIIPLGWTAWPPGIATGTTLYFQYAVQDSAASAGVALSNALKATTP